MKKIIKKTLAILCIAGLILGLIGCGKKFDASAYIQAELDLVTKHDVAQYVKIMGVSQTEAEAIYEDGIEAMNASLAELKNAGVPEDLFVGYEQWLANLLTKTKYTVLDETKSGDTYIVAVEVEPIKAFDNAAEALNEQLTVYMENMMEDILSGAEAPTDEEINYEVFVMLLDIANDSLANPTYGEKQVIEITIAKNSDGLYAPDEMDMTNLGMNLIDISGLYELQ